MAKAAWCTVAPMTGKENAPINVTLPAHTGRAARDTTVTVTNKNGTKPSKAITCRQAGAALFLNMDASKPDTPSTGGTITINGTSNLESLSWKTIIFIGGASTGINAESNIPGFSSSIKCNNESVPNGTDHSWGLLTQYSLVATLAIPASPFPVDVELRFTVSDKNHEIEKTCIFKYKAGASTLSVDKTSLSFPATGGKQTVNITSNDEWSIS